MYMINRLGSKYVPPDVKEAIQLSCFLRWVQTTIHVLRIHDRRWFLLNGNQIRAHQIDVGLMVSIKKKSSCWHLSEFSKPGGCMTNVIFGLLSLCRSWLLHCGLSAWNTLHIYMSPAKPLELFSPISLTIHSETTCYINFLCSITSVSGSGLSLSTITFDKCVIGYQQNGEKWKTFPALGLGLHQGSPTSDLCSISKVQLWAKNNLL